MAGQLGYLVLSSLTMNENLFAVMLANVHNLLVRRRQNQNHGCMPAMRPAVLCRLHVEREHTHTHVHTCRGTHMHNSVSVLSDAVCLWGGQHRGPSLLQHLAPESALHVFVIGKHQHSLLAPCCRDAALHMRGACLPFARRGECQLRHPSGQAACYEHALSVLVNTGLAYCCCCCCCPAPAAGQPVLGAAVVFLLGCQCRCMTCVCAVTDAVQCCVLLLLLLLLQDRLSAVLGSTGSPSTLAISCMIFALLLVNGICLRVPVTCCLQRQFSLPWASSSGRSLGWPRRCLYAGMPAQPTQQQQQQQQWVGRASAEELEGQQQQGWTAGVLKQLQQHTAEDDPGKCSNKTLTTWQTCLQSA